jgi:hypothetical protein
LCRSKIRSMWNFWKIRAQRRRQEEKPPTIQQIKVKPCEHFNYFLSVFLLCRHA